MAILTGVSSMPAPLSTDTDFNTHTHTNTSLNASERYQFDINGFMVIPGVLDAATTSACVDHLDRLRLDPLSLPIEQRSPLGGPCATLIDHPELMRVLTTIIGKRDKLRCENAWYCYRETGDGEWRPHAGGRSLNPNYQYINHGDGIYAGMTRVVWELNPVREGLGGTSFIAGSHKTPLTPTEANDQRDSGLWSSYACPAGSLVIFSEAVRHTTTPWADVEQPRKAMLCAYNHVVVRHHKPDAAITNPAFLDSLSPERRAFFNAVHHPQFSREPWTTQHHNLAHEWGLG